MMRFGVIILVVSTIVVANPVKRDVGLTDDIGIVTLNETEVCRVDGSIYLDGEELPTSETCEVCICRPPGFACTVIECNYNSECVALERSGLCCPEIRCDCENDGVVYRNGDRVTNTGDPCDVCYCQGGDIICSRITCLNRTDCIPDYMEGSCCPSYNSCPKDNITDPVTNINEEIATNDPAKDETSIIDITVEVQPEVEQTQNTASPDEEEIIKPIAVIEDPNNNDDTEIEVINDTVQLVDKVTNEKTETPSNDKVAVQIEESKDSHKVDELATAAEQISDQVDELQVTDEIQVADEVTNQTAEAPLNEEIVSKIVENKDSDKVHELSSLATADKIPDQVDEVQVVDEVTNQEAEAPLKDGIVSELVEDKDLNKVDGLQTLSTANKVSDQVDEIQTGVQTADEVTNQEAVAPLNDDIVSELVENNDSDKVHELEILSTANKVSDQVDEIQTADKVINQEAETLIDDEIVPKIAENKDSIKVNELQTLSADNKLSDLVDEVQSVDEVVNQAEEAPVKDEIALELVENKDSNKVDEIDGLISGNKVSDPVDKVETIDEVIKQKIDTPSNYGSIVDIEENKGSNKVDEALPVATDDMVSDQVDELQPIDEVINQDKEAPLTDEIVTEIIEKDSNKVEQSPSLAPADEVSDHVDEVLTGDEVTNQVAEAPLNDGIVSELEDNKNSNKVAEIQIVSTANKASDQVDELQPADEIINQEVETPLTDEIVPELVENKDSNKVDELDNSISDIKAADPVENVETADEGTDQKAEVPVNVEIVTELVENEDSHKVDDSKTVISVDKVSDPLNKVDEVSEVILSSESKLELGNKAQLELSVDNKESNKVSELIKSTEAVLNEGNKAQLELSIDNKDPNKVSEVIASTEAKLDVANKEQQELSLDNKDSSEIEKLEVELSADQITEQELLPSADESSLHTITLISDEEPSTTEYYVDRDDVTEKSVDDEEYVSGNKIEIVRTTLDLTNKEIPADDKTSDLEVTTLAADLDVADETVVAIEASNKNAQILEDDVETSVPDVVTEQTMEITSPKEIFEDNNSDDTGVQKIETPIVDEIIDLDIVSSDITELAPVTEEVSEKIESDAQIKVETAVVTDEPMDLQEEVVSTIVTDEIVSTNEKTPAVNNDIDAQEIENLQLTDSIVPDLPTEIKDSQASLNSDSTPVETDNQETSKTGEYWISMNENNANEPSVQTDFQDNKDDLEVKYGLKTVKENKNKEFRQENIDNKNKFNSNKISSNKNKFIGMNQLKHRRSIVDRVVEYVRTMW